MRRPSRKCGGLIRPGWAGAAPGCGWPRRGDAAISTIRTISGGFMAHELAGKKVAILAADGVERVELEQPRGALYGAGATTELLSIHDGEIQARQHDLVSAGTFPVDKQGSDGSGDDCHGLLFAGGMVSP